MTSHICAVCDWPLSFRWSDTHGVGVCNRCGLPYRIYHYENDARVAKPPTIAVKEAWLPLAREYWQQNKKRVFPGIYDIGPLRSRAGRTYSGATEEEMGEFGTWIDARVDRWPAEEAEARALRLQEGR